MSAGRFVTDKFMTCQTVAPGVGGVGVTPGVPATTDGSGGAGGRTAGGGLAADGGATQSKEDNLRMRLREDVLPTMEGGPFLSPQTKGGTEDIPFPGICEDAR